MEQQRGRIIIEPGRTLRFELADLLRRIRPWNLHAPVNTGRPIGGEVW